MKIVFKLSMLILVLTCSICLSGCGTGFPTGLIYTDVTLPVCATDNPEIKDYNVGKASCTKLFGIVAVGDASIKKAKENGSAVFLLCGSLEAFRRRLSNNCRRSGG